MVAVPSVDVANPCDYVCLDALDTSWGRIAVGTGWDDDGALSDGYLTAWLVHDGTSARTKLSTLGVPDLGVPHLVPWGNRVAIIATGVVGPMSTWITSDGTGWQGPTTFNLPGESPGHLFLTSWGSQLVILGEQFLDPGYLASVWTSTDGQAWELAPRPPGWDDRRVTGWWEGGDGFVVGIGREVTAESTTEWPWTSADLVHWRPIGSPYPCVWSQQSFDPWECLPTSGRRPT